MLHGRGLFVGAIICGCSQQLPLRDAYQLLTTIWTDAADTDFPLCSGRELKRGEKLLPGRCNQRLRGCVAYLAG